MSELRDQVRESLWAGRETKIPPRLLLKRCILEQAVLRPLTGGGYSSIHREILHHTDPAGTTTTYITLIGEMIRGLAKRGYLSVSLSGSHITSVVITDAGLVKLMELLDLEHTDQEAYLRAIFELD